MHLILLGGTNSEDQLVRAQVGNLVNSVTDKKYASFQLKIR